MTKWTVKELESRIKEVREEIYRKKRYMKAIQKEIEGCQIILEKYQDELSRLKSNPSSRFVDLENEN